MMKRLALVSMVVIVAMLATSVITAQDAVSVQVALDHPHAAFLESRAFGASKGATAEFRKMEWTIIDPATNKLYMTMTEITETMADKEGDIQVDENPCGIVYTADLDASFNMSALKPLIIGGPFNAEGGKNKCDVNNIAEPDGLTVDARGRLWIAEDTGLHENNVLWAYDAKDGSLKRFATLPIGAEVTGAYVAKDGTLFFNVQHPSAKALYPYNSSVVGVVTGFNANTDDFEPVAVPEGDAKKTVTVAAGSYQALGRAGDPIPGSSKGHVMGAIYDRTGKMLFVGNNADGNMWLPTAEDGSEGWLYSNHETQPGGVSKLYIRKGANGWDVLDGEMVDFASVNGTWNNCGSAPTAWGTGLSAEEYEPYANDLLNVKNMNAYMGKQANPYDYGWIVEITPRTTTTDTVAKRYAMGRKANENAWVAPDNKTVYFGDDGSKVMLFKFVAETEKDLSAGTLYAGKVTQSGGSGAEHVFNIEWIELGFGVDAEIAKSIREIDAQIEAATK